MMTAFDHTFVFDLLTNSFKDLKRMGPLFAYKVSNSAFCKLHEEKSHYSPTDPINSI